MDAEATRFALDIDRAPQALEETRLADADLVLPRPHLPAPAGFRFQVGERIDNHYEVLAVHEGGMGIVYVVFNHQRKLPRALKFLHPRLAGNATARRLFAEEAATWVRLDKHPCIVQAIGVQLLGAEPYIVAEFIRGQREGGVDLRSWLGRPALSTSVAVEMTLQIAQGMQHATRKIPGLVHRNLKPANILVDDHGRPKVTDFGLAAAQGKAAGTPAYMSPEQWREERVDCRSDIYALGCIAYELLTHHRVFAADSSEAWRAARWSFHRIRSAHSSRKHPSLWLTLFTAA